MWEKKIGSLVLGENPPQLLSHDPRSKGVFEAVPEPLDPDQILGSLDRLFQAIYSKQAPVKQTLNSVFTARIIDSYKDFISACRLTYGVYDHLKYLNQHNRLRVDMDKFTRFSIPFGVFEQQGEEEMLLGVTRLVLREPQPLISHFMDTLLSGDNPVLDGEASLTLADYVNQPRRAFSPMAESIDLSGLLKGFECQGVQYAESSRNVAHPDYRGFGVSRLGMASSLTHAFYSGLDVLIGQCDVNHVPMYQKYGCQVMPGKSLYVEENVQNITAALMIDFRAPLSGPAETMIKQVYFNKWRKSGYLCMCPNGDCTKRGAPFLADNSSECPLRGYTINHEGRN